MIPEELNVFTDYFPVTALPWTYYDMDLSVYSHGAESASAILGKVKPLARSIAGVGIAADAEADGSDIKVNVNVTASVANEYYLAVMLLENGIVHSRQVAVPIMYIIIRCAKRSARVFSVIRSVP
ncbi:MAG: Omp28-related outer membrane protein [Alistipes inops]